MKISIKREQSQAGLSFAEREKFRPQVKNKLLLLLALLMTAATGAWAQTPLLTIDSTDYPEFKSGSMTFDDKVTVTFSKSVYNDGDNFGWYAPSKASLLTVTGINGYTITSCKFYTDEGIAETGYTVEGESPSVYLSGGFVYTDDSKSVNLGSMGVAKIEVYTAAASSGYTVSMKDGVKDAGKWTVKVGEGEAQALPIGGLKGDGSETVTLQYNGRLKVKGVKATSDAGAPAEESVTLATPLTMEAQTDGTIEVKISDDSGNSSTLSTGMKYAVNGGEKTTITTTTTINVTKGDKVKFYGNGTSTTAYGNNPFVFLKGTAKTKVYGNIMSLLDETGYETATTLSSEKVFNGLFQANTNLTDASGLLLPAMTLTSGCYNAMFAGCTSLTAAPALPATTLAQTCYYSMFGGCSSLTAAPELPATTLANACYNQMFRSCTSLTTAPVLPATTLANTCYYMMFHTCSSLNSVTCLATDISATNCTKNWLYNVSATGTITTPSATNWTANSSDGIPSGWTRVATSDEPAVKPAATVTTVPTGAAVVGVGKTTALVSGGVADGGTLMYAVTTTNTKPASTDGFSDAVPTAKDITASGTVYVWYYVKGDDTHSDSEIAATAIEVPVADIVWDVTNVSNLQVWGTDQSYEKEGVTLSGNADQIQARYNGDPEVAGIVFEAYQSGGFTFTAPTGKAFTKIEMTLKEPMEWDDADLGSGWSYSGDSMTEIYKVTWKGSAAASTVGLLTGADMFSGTPVKSIAFYLSE